MFRQNRIPKEILTKQCQFSWWQAFLQDEERACTSDARREEIRTILMAFDD